ncbi:MAG: phosphate signaling complex protein PhoU [Phycisphaerae bacterium]
MSELQRNVDALMRQLDRMGLRVQQTVLDALDAVGARDLEAGQAVSNQDSTIDAEEVAVEKECVRLLALYQPTAVDLRSLCFVIKANNDLERIADKAASIGRRIRHLVADDIDLGTYPEWPDLVDLVTDRLDQTLRAISSRNLDAAQALVASDVDAEEAYRRIARHIIVRAREAPGGVDMAVTLTLLVRAVHRIGELCTNIAEDIIFVCTGDIIRHADARETER